jgi:2-dehydropantoate 2-reductase
MRTLVVGAGAIGGYFGGRLLEAHRDVTFLVRPRRAEELAAMGLRIQSRFGDVAIAAPPTVLTEEIRETFDLVLLSCKAYDLEGAMASLAPAVGPETAILPLLNGMRHLDTLDKRFGPARVLGGQCRIAVTVNEQHEIVHLNATHDLSFGERDGSLSDRVRAIAQLMMDGKFNARLSTEIVFEMWEKWVLLATLAGSTCLMRAAIGDICTSPGGTDLILGLLRECSRTAAAEGFPMREVFLTASRDMLTATRSDLTASMLRDIDRNARIEADHIVGDMLQREPRESLASGDCSFLRVVYTHLKAYEARRTRTMSTT